MKQFAIKAAKVPKISPVKVRCPACGVKLAFDGTHVTKGTPVAGRDDQVDYGGETAGKA